MRRHANVVNIDEIEPRTPPSPGPARFGASVKRLAVAAGGSKLGANLFQVPAGKTAVPHHAHLGNEEAIYLLRGRGTLRIGNDRVEVRPGDWIALPTGEAHAHQLLADQGEELEYLCISTMNEVDVVTYPDSGKLLAAFGGHPPAGTRKMFRLEDSGVDYWDGEDAAPDKPEG
jgi:uncharacterized cupin superfamily protein